MTDAVIEARQPEPGRPGAFRRTFLMPLKDVAEHVIRDIKHPMHEANIREVLRDGVRRGLRHVDQAPVVDQVEQRDDGLTAVTYALPVAPTEAAVAVTTSKRSPVPAPAVGPEPEFTVDPDDSAEDQAGDAADDGTAEEAEDVPTPRHALDSEN